MSRTALPIADGRTTARLAWRLLSRRPAALATTVAAFVVAALAGVVAPYVIGRLVDDVRADASVSVVWGWGAVLAVAAVVGGVATALSFTALARSAAPALATVREDVLDRALHLDARTLEAAGSGDVLSRVGDDVQQVTESFDEALPLLLSSVLAILFTLGALTGLDWRLGLAGLTALPCYVASLRWYLPRSGPRYREERVAHGVRAEALVVATQGAETLRAFGRERQGIAAVERSSRAAVDVTLGVFSLLTRFFNRINASETVGLLATLVVGFLLVRSGAATVGEATAAALYFHRLFNPVGAVLMVFDQVQSAGASLARMAGVALLPERDEPPSATPATRGRRLALRAVRHAYDGPEVLHGIDLEIAPGTRTAVVGSTGAGKTTLAAIAAGQLVADGGTIELDGCVVDPPTLAREVVLVTQEVHVFTGTVRDNLTLGAPQAEDADLWDALGAVGAAPWVGLLTEGLSTRVGSGATTLTAAQAQQLALARLVLRDPAVVVLDEATAEAGSAGARALDDAADRALAGRTALVVAHRLSQAARCDEVVVLEHGRVVERGPHAALAASDGPYARLWAAWSGA